MAAWLAQAGEDELSVALVEGEGILGHKSAEVLLPLVFLRWGTIDRAGALDALAAYYRNPPAEGAREIDCLGPFFVAWAEDDPHAALEAMLTLDLPRGVRRPVNEVFDDLCERDAKLAASLSVELASSSEGERRGVGFSMFSTVMKRLSEAEGPDQALAWAAQQPTLAVREQLIVGLTESLLSSGNDADAILAYAALSPAAATGEADLVKNIAEAMVRTDQVGARNWALALPLGELREASISKMTAVIAEKQSPAQALEWLHGCGSQADCDEAYRALAASWPADDSAGKYRCVQGIADPVQRSWRKYDAAFAWLRADEVVATSALPAGTTAKWKQMVELANAYEKAATAIFPGADASFTISPQAGVAADEPGN